jgi:hypothetical protein
MLLIRYYINVESSGTGIKAMKQIIQLNDFAHITMDVCGRERALRRFDYTDNPFPADQQDMTVFEEAGKILAKDGEIIPGGSGYHEDLLIIDV